MYFQKEMANTSNPRVLIQKMYKPDNTKFSIRDRGALLCIGARKWLSDDLLAANCKIKALKITILEWVLHVLR